MCQLQLLSTRSVQCRHILYDGEHLGCHVLGCNVVFQLQFSISIKPVGFDFCSRASCIGKYHCNCQVIKSSSYKKRRKKQVQYWNKKMQWSGNRCFNHLFFSGHAASLLSILKQYNFLLYSEKQPHLQVQREKDKR